MENLSHKELVSRLDGFQQSYNHLYIPAAEGLGKLAFEVFETKTVIFKSEHVLEGCRHLGLLISCNELYRYGKTVIYS